jgi:uncharacterized surface protein with fasciclin (FAS1) repeats
MLNIIQYINTDKNFKILKKGIHASDMDQVLNNSGPFTFFAPSDLAFEKLEKGFMEEMLEPNNRGRLADLVKNHIVNGKMELKELKNGDQLNTINGKVLSVQVKDGNVSIDDVTVVTRDTKTINGVIHSLDTVLLNK